jgi:ParB-like chromosome segregation protein Spo0J
MELGKVFVDDVVIGENRRAIDKVTVERLAESMKAIGLQTPISIWADDRDRPVLVAGHHRLEAAKSLGWEQIECCFVAMNEVERQIWEISENLMRADLTKEQRDRDIRRLAELLRKREEDGCSKVLQPSLDSVGRRKSPQQQPGIVKKIANETGLSKDTVRRALSPPAPKPQPPARPAINQFESVERQIDALMRAWNSAGPEAREEFLRRIDKPVFDQTEAA